jgi:hypothetical protein
MVGEKIVVDKEECVRVTLLLKKRYVEFLMEYGGWIGYKEQTEFLEKIIGDSIKSTIYSILDEASVIAPLKIHEFKRKYKLTEEEPY